MQNRSMMCVDLQHHDGSDGSNGRTGKATRDLDTSTGEGCDGAAGGGWAALGGQAAGSNCAGGGTCGGGRSWDDGWSCETDGGGAVHDGGGEGDVGDLRSIVRCGYNKKVCIFTYCEGGHNRLGGGA